MRFLAVGAGVQGFIHLDRGHFCCVSLRAHHYIQRGMCRCCRQLAKHVADDVIAHLRTAASRREVFTRQADLAVLRTFAWGACSPYMLLRAF